MARELSRALRDGGQASLAEQVDQASLTESRSTTRQTLVYIYVRPSRDLNVVEANIVGVRHGETVEVETPYWTNIDMDNLDRLTGVEVAAPGTSRTS